MVSVQLARLRLWQRIADSVDVLAFALCPFPSWATSLSVGKSKLELKQWPGRKVGSGGWVWGASRRLALHFHLYGDGCAASPGRVVAMPARAWNSLKVIDLGAGTGASGLAASVLGADVTLTDQAHFCYPDLEPGTTKVAQPLFSLLDLIRINVRQNSTQLLGQPPSVCELLWGGDEQMMAQLPNRHYDVICGSDILLFQNAHKALIHTLCCLSQISSIVLIEHTDRGNCATKYPEDMLHFLRLVEDDQRWFPSVVRDHGRHLTVRMVRIQRGGSPFVLAELPARDSA